MHTTYRVQNSTFPLVWDHETLPVETPLIGVVYVAMSWSNSNEDYKPVGAAEYMGGGEWKSLEGRDVTNAFKWCDYIKKYY